MQLSTGNRRQVIEDLLDINIFTKMNKILREENSKMKETLRDTEYQIKTAENKESVQIKYIEDLERLNEEMITEKQQEIERQESIGVAKQAEVDKLDKRIKAGRAEYDKRKSSFDSARKSLERELMEARGELRSLQKESKFFETNDTCPTCTQEIDSVFKLQRLGELAEKSESGQSAVSAVESNITKLDDRVVKLSSALDFIREDEDKRNEYYSEIKTAFGLIKSLQKDITTLQKKTGDIEKARKDLKTVVEDLLHYRTLRVDQTEVLTYNAVMFEMLKDTGIKTKIIRQYLPVMNKLINQYLQVLDFFVSFHLDENFTEVIKSRHRDEFSYASFSEGEKQRIDLALLFTWRQVAKMKNSVSTNLLILDETFDSSLDTDGVDNLLKILDTLDPNTNVFVISHKGHMLAEKFESGLSFEKVNNFSVMRES